MKRILLFASMALASIAFAQNESTEYKGEYAIKKIDANHPCITPNQYKIIEKQLADNRKLLRLDNKAQSAAMSTTFNWPLQMANGLNDCSYYYIGNYVDQDTTSPGIKDWNCGSVTYDGHRGNDICSSPYPYYKMDNNMLQVIAAAPGTIVNKIDGHYDKNCVANDSIANYIIVEHADGSVALYWHMKKNSLTAKTVGQTVVTGEFLGVVGSSGDATGPHLHFEVWSGTTTNTLKDAYAGACNTLNANTLWVTQKPYREPAIIKAQINSIAPIFTSCPTTETPNEDSCFSPGATAKFYIFIRNETSGLVANMSIISPGGTTYSSWTHNSVNTYTPTAYYFTNKVLPATAGTYTFQATYNGITCSKTFSISCGAMDVNQVKSINSQIAIYPNPNNGSFVIEPSNATKQTMQVYDVTGKMVLTQTINGKISIDASSLNEGVYNISLQSNEGVVNKRLVIVR